MTEQAIHEVILKVAEAYFIAGNKDKTGWEYSSSDDKLKYIQEAVTDLDNYYRYRQAQKREA